MPQPFQEPCLEWRTVPCRNIERAAQTLRGTPGTGRNCRAFGCGTQLANSQQKEPNMAMMRAAVFEKQGSIKLREVPKPKPGVGEALIRVTLTTICGTDVHILRGEYPVRAGLVVGHEPVGVVEEVGPGVVGYERGDRVIV